ncbi:MAG: hypothetical protein HQ456_07585 [Polynucleobacter sp.]|nr:hypothetical protein [Polynucleobacter sp.]
MIQNTQNQACPYFTCHFFQASQAAWSFCRPIFSCSAAFGRSEIAQVM